MTGEGVRNAVKEIKKAMKAFKDDFTQLSNQLNTFDFDRMTVGQGCCILIAFYLICAFHAVGNVIKTLDNANIKNTKNGKPLDIGTLIMKYLFDDDSSNNEFDRARHYTYNRPHSQWTHLWDNNAFVTQTEKNRIWRNNKFHNRLQNNSICSLLLFLNDLIMYGGNRGNIVRFIIGELFSVSQFSYLYVFLYRFIDEVPAFLDSIIEKTPVQFHEREEFKQVRECGKVLKSFKKDTDFFKKIC